MAMYGYVRCSDDRQTVMQQMDQLRAAGCDRIYRDKATRATAEHRPSLQQVRKVLKAGDTSTVTAIDSAFRSTFEAIAFLDALMREGVIFPRWPNRSTRARRKAASGISMPLTMPSMNAHDLKAHAKMYASSQEARADVRQAQKAKSEETPMGAKRPQRQAGKNRGRGGPEVESIS
jgi:DNA invertase Pin-like site-specific DNA recombinase